jgi:Tfp pilus assembly protein PilF
VKQGKTQKTLAIMNISPWILPVSVMFLSLLFRIIYLIKASTLPTFLSPGMDAEIYQIWADNLVAGKPFDTPFFRAPLYPYLIAAIARVFNGDTFWPVRIIQITVSAVSAGILSILVRRWFGNRPAWFAGSFWACYGLSIYFDCEGLITSFYASLFIIFLFLFDNFYRTKKLKHLLVAAIVLAIMTAFRANALVWWPIFILYTLYLLRVDQKFSLLKSMVVSGSLVLIFILILSPVYYHNLIHGGGLSISTQGGINLYLGNNSETTGAYAVDPEFGNDWTKDQVHNRAEKDLGSKLSESEVSGYYSKKAIEYWISNPFDAIKLTSKKALLLVNRVEIGNNRILLPFIKQVHPIFFFLSVICFPILAIFSLPFVIEVWKKYPQSRLAILFAVTHAASMLAFFINARYRFPMIPVMIIISGYGIKRVAEIVQNLRRKPDVSSYKSLALIGLFILLIMVPIPTSTKNHQRNAWLFHQGNAAMRLGDYKTARSNFLELVKLKPEYRNANLNLGVTYYESEELDSAEFYYNRELNFYPNSSKVWNNIGLLHEQINDNKSAILAYTQAIDLDNTDPDPRLNLARIYDKMAGNFIENGETSEALEYSLKAFEASPETVRFGYNYAVILAQSGNIEGAITLLTDITEKHPDFKPARDALLRAKQYR